MSWTFLLKRIDYYCNLEVIMKAGDLVELIGYPYVGVVQKTYIDSNGEETLVVITADGMQWDRSKSEFYLLEDQ